MVPFESFVSYSRSIVTTALSCFHRQKETLVENHDFYKKNCRLLHSTRPRRNTAISWYVKIRMVWLPDGEKKTKDMFSCFDRIPACETRTDTHLGTAESTR